MVEAMAPVDDVHRQQLDELPADQAASFPSPIDGGRLGLDYLQENPSSVDWQLRCETDVHLTGC